MLLGCIKDIVGVYQGCCRSVSRVLSGCIKGVVGVYQECCQGVLRVCCYISNRPTKRLSSAFVTPVARRISEKSHCYSSALISVVNFWESPLSFRPVICFQGKGKAWVSCCVWLRQLLFIFYFQRS